MPPPSEQQNIQGQLDSTTQRAMRPHGATVAPHAAVEGSPLQQDDMPAWGGGKDLTSSVFEGSYGGLPTGPGGTVLFDLNEVRWRRGSREEDGSEGGSVGSLQGGAGGTYHMRDLRAVQVGHII